jgi:hypothetical protein
MTRIVRSPTAFTLGAKKVRTKVKVRSIQQLDQIFSLCVRERAEWTCERCNKAYQRGTNGLHCSHLFSRRHRSTRWAPENCCAHCMACHSYLGGNPVIFAQWIADHLGEQPLFDLHAKMRSIVKVRPRDREDMYQHFVKVHAEMLRLRDMGITGRIPFEGWQG